MFGCGFFAFIFFKSKLKDLEKFPHTSIWLCTLQSQLITDVLCWVPKDVCIPVKPTTM